jgi:hypothetical protein
MILITGSVDSMHVVNKEITQFEEGIGIRRIIRWK